MLFVPLETAEWQPHRMPTRRVSARPRLAVPKDSFRRDAQRKADAVALNTLNAWYAFEAPIDREIVTAQMLWQRLLQRPLGGLYPFPPFALWVPYGNTTNQPMFPGYVLVLTDQPFIGWEQRQLQRVLAGFLSDGPWRLNPLEDIPWPQVHPAAGWLSVPAVRSLLAPYFLTAL